MVFQRSNPLPLRLSQHYHMNAGVKIKRSWWACWKPHQASCALGDQVRMIFIGLDLVGGQASGAACMPSSFSASQIHLVKGSSRLLIRLRPRSWKRPLCLSSKGLYDYHRDLHNTKQVVPVWLYVSSGDLIEYDVIRQYFPNAKLHRPMTYWSF